MKFLIDECLSPTLVRLGHELGHETSSVHHLGMLAEKDWQLAAFAIQHGWTLITHNVKDFRGQKGQPGFITQAALHPGLIALTAIPIHRQAMEIIVKAGMQYALLLGDLINQVIEVHLEMNSLSLLQREFPVLS
jgi:predicted nuclease of predicted toxin-antitoxin system